MSKPVLGRGLSSLLGAAGTAEPGGRVNGVPGGDPAGVQLLLRGTDGSELVPALPTDEQESTPVLPRWALAGAVVADGVLILVAAWGVLGQTGWGRYVVATLLLSVGAAVLSMAVWLRGQPAVRELESLNPLGEEKPRLRVQFMDEAPRRRD